MACCGRSVRVSAKTGPEGAGGSALFEAQGAAPLTVFGRVTGRRYHFPGPGARVYVDGRDAPVLDVTRGLVRVEHTAS